ncbi:MAG: lipoyl synthase [Desulfococcaceae bacterium]
MTQNAPPATPPPLEIQDWGRMEYEAALRRQHALVEDRIADQSPDRLVLVEHPPVVTLGRGGSAGDLCQPEAVLRQKGIAVRRVERGGMATFHGPGQLVVYPIVKLHQKDLRRFLSGLLGAMEDLLQSYDLRPERKTGQPGLWVNGAKIASVGLAVRKWVTFHGMALNVDIDPGWFDSIVPCGHPGERITSMERERDRAMDMAQVKARFVRAFADRFGRPRVAHAEIPAATRPPWLHLQAANPEAVGKMEEMLRGHRLGSVCQSAHCPNLGECFSRGTATFLILGAVCSRRCRFCAVQKGDPAPPDPDEPDRVARAAEAMGLRHVVVTSVTRDDLPDGGAGHFAATIRRVRARRPEARVEALVPDFQGDRAAVDLVAQARPDVFNHNVETVPRLYPSVRPGADYRRSLNLLAHAAEKGLTTKSGLMLGLGETVREIAETLADLRRANCALLTLGQYLAPSAAHVPVHRYRTPEEFRRWGEIANEMGFRGVASGPLARSSHRADEMFERGAAGPSPAESTDPEDSP